VPQNTGKNSIKHCRIVKDRIRCALHNFRVRLTPWQPMV
jgi:hypothetical protein